MSASRDPSRRYILAEDAPYVANLAALWGSDPELARQIEELEGQELQGGYAVEPSKAGPPTVAVSNDDGKAVYLHSRYQPLDEARRLVENLATDEQVAFFIHGFGLGYHVEMLFERVSEEALLCVIEPDLKLLRTALWQRDFSKLLASGRVVFLTQANKAELFLRLQAHQAILSLGAAVVVHPPSMQCHPAFHQQMREWVQEFSSYCRTSINTLVLNGKRTAENIARNLAWYVATADLQRLKNCYHNKPAVIVSAGPSLRKNKHLLKDLQGKAVLISVQTMLQPLLEMGIEPHFVTSLDYHDICTRFFEKLPKNLKTELVAEPKATSKIFSLHPGPLSLLGNDFAESLLREMKLNKEKLPAGATVAHLAYCLAEYLGCNPIVFVGQDLGFSDGLCYAAGTSYEDVWRPEMSRFCTIEMKQWEQIVRDRKILRRIPDIHGNPMYTEERLFTYLQHFERDFATSDRTIIDATEGGAMKRGTRVMKLAEVIAQYCTEGTKAQRHEGTKEFTCVPACLCAFPLAYGGEGAENLQVVAAGVGLGVGDGALAHASLHLLDRDIFVLLHPIEQVLADVVEVADAVLEQGGSHHGNLGPGHHRLEHVHGGVNAAGDGDVALHQRRDDGDPVQAQQQFIGGAEDQVRRHGQVFQVDVGLVEAVKQHQGISAGGIEFPRHVGEGAEGVAELDGHGDLHAAFHLLDEIAILALDLLGGGVGIVGDIVDVQFQGIGAGLLHLFRILRPAAARDAVEAGDDGNINGRFCVMDQLQVGVGADLVTRQVGEIAERFGKTVDAVGQAAIEVVAVDGDLLLEERMEDDGRCAVVFHLADIGEVLGQRRAGDHQGVFQRQAEIFG